ncbi:helix-turn-helix transcriptional regulator [Alloacidobacterium sp.]|uniref:helix-turn-helix transcriptional regulator n=1 Tax=Alloacidobacterium sp. TaxID=2951999 RepID=UPI002D3F59A3|nr:AlpA family phage regulatory protein [Alloacidobacterium sp.]HYK34716.1 AlpA family phage regulatory protein [Alloacidobacterium sp.]
MGRQQIVTGHQVLRRPQVLDKIGLHRTRLYELMASGEFPRPFKLGKRSVGWLASDIDDWIEQRMNASKLARN